MYMYTLLNIIRMELARGGNVENAVSMQQKCMECTSTIKRLLSHYRLKSWQTMSIVFSNPRAVETSRESC
ncbi:hypothetical protein DPMN_055097 [Dreissena polymorpha]|uniref:Uncharacterized protein n=1 Tax=Dreissena polymorpha TaxID=45954 RepID=A0A9D4CR14_DREPO|nr:hypothetical protein DPMN_055097 [Dreissena polymorpha]